MMKSSIFRFEARVARFHALSKRAPRMIEGEYPLVFNVRLHRKDLNIALQAAQAPGLDLPLARMVFDVEEDLIEEGLGDSDIAAIGHFVIGSRDARPTAID